MEGGTGVNSDTVRTWLTVAAASLREQREYLTQLDAAIGDADHGTNMDRGFTAVVEKIEGVESSDPPGRILTTAGTTLVSSIRLRSPSAARGYVPVHPTAPSARRQARAA